MGMKSTGGEIVQVQGGHIVRSTGRKDRHSKVYTAKGPRDRRVRLSAHTAIQFYDVQDRLGYDRPSKAVDWLIKKAKSAIDKLDELPPWNPIQNATEGFQEEEDNNNGLETSKMVIAAENSESSGYNLQQNHNHSGFIQSSIDNDAIAFFPTSSVGDSMNFQSYSSDIISRTNNSTQDLGLSLHSFQDNSGSNDQTLFSESNHVGFDANYHRIVNWNNDHHGTTTDMNMNMNMNMNRTGFMVNNSPASFLGQGSAFSSHRGTLQSSFSPSLRPWNDIPMADSSVDHHNQKSHQPIHHGSIFGSRFLSDALTGFCIPARIQGEDENHGVGSEQPSSSSNSHH